jgi:5'-3' exonuclease
MTYRMLLDTSGLMYRAFFALPTSMRDDEGHAINAVHGCVDMTAFLIERYRPDDAVHVYDHDWRPAPRVALYAGYKANRNPDPPELPAQFDLLREVLDALGQPQAEAPGWEAEDAIASIVARDAPPGSRARVDVVTGDRDLIQLVRDPEVRVLFTGRGVSKLEVFDEAAVEAKYGVPASRYSEFAILRGDPSDGLPGVPGVGQKTSAALIRSYGSLDELVAAADARRLSRGPTTGSPRLVANLRAATGYLRTMQEVVPMRTDVELSEWRPSPDPALVDELAERHRLKGPVDRLRAALRATA